jgi:hypothetical protein
VAVQKGTERTERKRKPGSGRAAESPVFMRARQEAARQRWRARRIRGTRAKGARIDRRLMRRGEEGGTRFVRGVTRVSWAPLVRRWFPWGAREEVGPGRLRGRPPGSRAGGPGLARRECAGVLRLTAGIDGAWRDAPASSGRAWLRRSPRSIGRLTPRFPAEGWRRGSAAIARNFPVRCGRRCSSNRWVETSDEEPIATLPSGRGAGGRPGADWVVFYEVTNNVSRHLYRGCGNLGGDRMRTAAKWGAN